MKGSERDPKYSQDFQLGKTEKQRRRGNKEKYRKKILEIYKTEQGNSSDWNHHRPSKAGENK